MNKVPDIASKALVGSRAYEINSPTSDMDYINIFAAPTLEIASMDWHTRKNTHVHIEDGYDNVYYEVAHFFKMIANGNPKTLEVIFSPMIFEDENKIINFLRENSHIVLSAASYKEASIGFLTGLNHELKNSTDENFKFKTARTAILYAAGVHEFLTTGIYRFNFYNATFVTALSKLERKSLIQIIEDDVDVLRSIVATDKLSVKGNSELLKSKLKAIRINNM